MRIAGTFRVVNGQNVIQGRAGEPAERAAWDLPRQRWRHRPAGCLCAARDGKRSEWSGPEPAVEGWGQGRAAPYRRKMRLWRAAHSKPRGRAVSQNW
jgi:hypothetical protein